MDSYSFITDHIVTVLGGYGLVIGGFSAFLAKLWSSRILAREKSVLDQKIESLKTQHKADLSVIEYQLKYELARSDQFHQISKSTFEKIFDKKVEVYTKLLKLATQFRKYRNENYENEIFDPSVEYSIHFSGFRNLLEENRLYISNELVDSYDRWYSKAASYFKLIDKEHFDSAFKQEGRVPTDDEIEDVQYRELPHLQT